MNDDGVRSNLTALSAVALFLMLWLPLGQHEFLIQNWMKVGTFAAPLLLLTYSATATKRSNPSDPQFMSVLLLIAYIAHQFEEHWIDLLGNEYAFYDYVNALIRSVLSREYGEVAPLTPRGIFIINTSLVWLVGVLAIARSRYHLFPLVALAAISLVNGFTHILASIFTFKYNPGVLTSLLLFLPLTAVCYLAWAQRERALRGQIAVSLIWAILAHFLMVGGMLAANVYRLVSEELYFAALIVWSALPSILFRGSSNNASVGKSAEGAA
ncbi:MAG: HXXEE domain-containing protein [Pseudomonadota bacterium]